jgi:hypothetical protein
LGRAELSAARRSASLLDWLTKMEAKVKFIPYFPKKN